MISTPRKSASPTFQSNFNHRCEEALESSLSAAANDVFEFQTSGDTRVLTLSAALPAGGPATELWAAAELTGQLAALMNRLAGKNVLSVIIT